MGCCIAIALIIAGARRITGRGTVDAGFAPPAHWPAPPREPAPAAKPRDTVAHVLVGVGAAWLVLSLIAMHVLGLVEFTGAADVAFHGIGTVLMAIGTVRLMRFSPGVVHGGR